tara:strand:- start:1629 stop:4763 length:3135 start_codon:yes stop_codon:yes gene_type:complete
MNSKESTSDPVILGIDIGVASVGWALVKQSKSGASVQAAGSRIFDPGVEGSEKDIADGRDTPKSVERRNARQVRRQLWRRRRRKRKLFRTLQKYDLLPQGDDAGSGRGEIIQNLDRTISRFLEDKGIDANPKKLYHQLRASALEHPLPPHLLGRALIHLGQHRGYQSNSKRFRSAEEDADLGPVESQIKETQAHLTGTYPTVGSLLASLDPNEERLRGRYLGRSMIKDEFEQIVDKQIELGLDLKDYAKQHIRRVMFFQRPLRSAKGLVGRCDLEGDGSIGPRNCKRADPVFQEFRYLQKLNDLKLTDKRTGEIRELHEEERQAALELLEAPEDYLGKKGKLTFATLRKNIGLDKPTQWTTNFEDGGDKDFPYAKTLSSIRSALGEEWEGLAQQDRNDLVVLVLGEAHDDALVRLATERHGISEQAAQNLTQISLEAAYANHSRKAFNKLLPLMRQGDPYATARKEIYGSKSGGKGLDRLPPVHEVIPHLANPTVNKSLTQLRKVVNAIIREHGKPDRIRVELARDLKRGRKDRAIISKGNRARAKIRETAKETLMELGFQEEPKRGDIEKYLLWQECNEQCPYTGKPISFTQLFGPNPEFDVEHIMPLSRSLDNSFFNKTLCHAKENREVKKNLTPYECYSKSSRYHGILERVKQFKGDANVRLSKLKKFRQEQLDDGFAQRHLNDTRYASVASREYLGTLYGGETDVSGTMRVQVTTGMLTAVLRSCWDLNALIGLRDAKNRADHRHHAIDAAVVAQTNHSLITQMQTTAKKGYYWKLSSLEIPTPGPDFKASLEKTLDDMIPSKAISRRVRGPLHQETYYAAPTDTMKARKRVALRSLTKTQVSRIVDPKVRSLVTEALGSDDPSKRFAEGNPMPHMPNRRGSDVPIKSVRIEVPETPTTIGKGARRRHVKTGSNHHMCVYIHEETQKGRYEIVSMLEAHKRISSGKSWMQPNPHPGERFLFSVGQGDALMKPGAAPEEIMVVTGITSGEITCRLARDGRTAVERIKAGEKIRLRSPTQFVSEGYQKITINPLGSVRRAND